VVGNHDHHLVVQKQEREFMERAARGDLFPVYIPSLCWNLTISGLRLEMFYPAYRISCCHRSVLFAHGHHLDGMQSVSMQVVEMMRRRSGEEMMPSDLEMMMAYAYESIYRSAAIGELIAFEDHLWKASSLLHKFKEGLFRRQRYAPVERQYEAIQKFLREQNPEKVDCFIYGDTHRPGIFQRQGGPLAVNTGSFTREPGKESAQRRPDTYLLLNESGLVMRQLGHTKPLFLIELL
jgi:UDP-2,3-diacylglucosamine pyrophosphatase LpxH